MTQWFLMLVFKKTKASAQLTTRDLVIAEYKTLSRLLYQEGRKTEARAISKLAKELTEKSPKTRSQREFDQQQAPENNNPSELDIDM